MKRAFTTLTILGIILLAAPAMAEIESHSAEISPMFGILFGPQVGFSDDFRNYLDLINEPLPEYKVKSNIIFGGAMGYNVSPRLGFEGMFGYSPNQGEWSISGLSVDQDMDVLVIGANAVAHLNPEDSAVIYGTGGMGMIQWRFGDFHDPFGFIDTDSAVTNQTGLMWNFGGGVKFEATDNMFIRIEARDFMGKLEITSDEITGADLPPELLVVDEWLHHFILWGGVTFTFGGE
ncbi:outer membrane protein [Acidobacteriota bacterium]